MLLEQFDHIVVKALALFTWLNEAQYNGGLVTRLDYTFVFTQNSFCFPFSIYRHFKQYILQFKMVSFANINVIKKIFYW